MYLSIPLQRMTSLRRRAQGTAPLLRHIGCVVSKTMTVAIMQGVSAAGGGACNACTIALFWF